MNLRSIKLSDEVLFKRAENNIMNFVNKYYSVNLFLTVNNRLKDINNLLFTILQNIHIYLKIQNTKYNDSIEKFFNLILNKNIFIENKIEELACNIENNNDKFYMYANRIVRKINKFKSIINEHKNRKYIVILMKTNRDVYYNILSYL